MVFENATDGPVANYVQRLSHVAESPQLGNVTTGEQLMFAAKKATDSGLTLAIVIAFTITGLTLLLAVFETTRCLVAIAMRKNGKKWRNLVICWRWFYALLLSAASLVQAMQLILFLLAERGSFPREPSQALSVTAFAVYSCAALLILAMMSGNVGVDKVDYMKHRARQTLCTVSTSLSIALVLGVAGWMIIIYRKAASQLNATLGVLLARKGDCQDDACNDATVANGVAGELHALGNIDTFKGVTLLLLACLVLWTSFETISSRRRQAAEDNSRLQTEAAEAASVASRQLDWEHDLKRQNSGSSWYSEVAPDVLQAPPSCRSKSIRSDSIYHRERSYSSASSETMVGEDLAPTLSKMPPSSYYASEVPSTVITAAVQSQLKADVRDVRWMAGLALLAIMLYAIVLVLKACIGSEVDLGDRPGFELVCIVWQAVVSNMHLPLLALLMGRGVGYLPSE